MKQYWRDWTPPSCSFVDRSLGKHSGLVRTNRLTATCSWFQKRNQVLLRTKMFAKKSSTKSPGCSRSLANLASHSTTRYCGTDQFWGLLDEPVYLHDFVCVCNLPCSCYSPIERYFRFHCRDTCGEESRQVKLVAKTCAITQHVSHTMPKSYPAT